MPINKDNILAKKWGYEITRNLPVWHSQYNILAIDDYQKKYHLPGFFQLRLHRGFHCDFYYLLGPVKYSRDRQVKKLESNLLDKKYVSFLKKTYPLVGRRLLKAAKKLDLSVKSWQTFFNCYREASCLLDITAMGSKLVSDKLENKLKDFFNKTEIVAYYGRAKHLSPLEKLENELRQLSLRRINIKTEAKRLFGKYCWIPLNFVSEPWSVKDFEDKIKNYQTVKKVVLPKPSVKLDQETSRLLNLLGIMAELNEYRKAVFSQSSWIIRPRLEQIGRANNLDGWKEVSLLTSEEILDLLRGRNNYQSEVLKKRGEIFAFYNQTKNKIGFLNSAAALMFEKKFGKVDSRAREVKGVAANRGVKKGRVKLVFSPADFKNFCRDDILVAKMTSTDFIPIMKRAGAFVTDEGGLACHAAIVSREYDKPCIIGTKIATKVFKDGDLVEVDANKGIVRKI